MPRVIEARDTRFGGYLEDYEPGDVYRHWPGKTITEAEDHMFCMLTMAASPLHVDRQVRARPNPSSAATSWSAPSSIRCFSA